jgi:tRNA (cmo5U34)-methyltransferase
MSVASHLGIDLTEYDARIRTFIPGYEEMLDVAAAALPRSTRHITDLGTGTGALASRCLKAAPSARLTGIDGDADILQVAARRLGTRAAFVHGSFLRLPLPKADAVVASFSLHHVRTRGAKRALYGRIRRSLRPGGVFVEVDSCPASAPGVKRAQFEAWLRHLRRAYTPAKAAGFLRAWSHEDVYVPLDAEIALIARAGFRVEILWRKGAFVVLCGRGV